MTKAALETVKEFGRIVLLALLAFLLTEGVVGFLVDRFLSVQLSPIEKTLVIGAFTTALKTLDKLMYENKKTSGVETKWTGLLPF